MKKALIGGLIITAVCMMTIGPLTCQAQTKGPIKIGYIIPVTGAFAEVGRDMTNGTVMFLEEIGYRVAGRKIEVITEDDEANPTTGLTKLRKVVERDGVPVVAGVFLASTGYAFHPYIE